MSMMTDEPIEDILKVKINDLALRYELHGSSLRLIEELTRDTALLGDLATRKQFFESAIHLSPVNTKFFQTFLEDPDFVANAEPGGLFDLYYKAACVTASPDLWTSLIEVALMPDVDFSSENISAEFNGPPVLFPAPDLFLGVLDFPLSLGLATSQKQRWTGCSPEIEATGSGIEALCNGIDVAPMEQLLVAALSVAGHHPTASSHLWSLARATPQRSLRDLLEKWQGATVTLHHPTEELLQATTTSMDAPSISTPVIEGNPSSGLISSGHSATLETSGGLVGGGGGSAGPPGSAPPRRRRTSRSSSLNAGTTAGSNSEPSALFRESPAEEMKELMWMIFCESWKLRLLYYRQLSTASLNLSEILDEYRLFETDVPDYFRITEAPVNAALSRPHDFKKAVTDAMVERCMKVALHAEVHNRKHRCLGLAEKLVSASEKQWKKRKRYETAVSSSAMDNEDISDETSEQFDLTGGVRAANLLGASQTGGSGGGLTTQQRRGSGNRIILAADLMDDDVDAMVEDENEKSELWEGRDGRNAGTGSALWTKYLQFEEAVLDRLTERLDQTSTTGDNNSAVGGGLSNELLTPSGVRNSGGTSATSTAFTSLPHHPSSPHSVSLPSCPPQSTNNGGTGQHQQVTSSSSQQDILSAIETIIYHTRNKVIVQKRQVAATFIRAVEALGDVRLDIFEGFWDFLNRAATDNIFVPSSKWLSFWLHWIADSAARHQPLKSCCWNRLFTVIKQVGLAECEDLGSFVESFRAPEDGAFFKCLMGPPWWRVSEVLPPPMMLGGPRDLNIPSVDVLQSHTSEFLHAITRALRILEETYRDLQSQDRLFFRGTGGPPTTREENTSSNNPPESSEALYEAVSSILEMTEQRVLEMANYINEGDGVGDPGTLYQAFFTTMLMGKVLRGIFMARLSRPISDLLGLFESIDSIVTAFDRLQSPLSVDAITITATIWNLKIGLVLIFCVCSDVRYFTNLKGSWIASCLIRGELDPRVIAKTLLSQPVDQSFQLVLQRLAEDEDFGVLKTRPSLVEKVVILSELAAVASAAVCEQHPIFVLFEWISRLSECLKTGSEWSLPEEVPETVELLPAYPLPSPSLFPKLGAPVRVALEELKARPFHSAGGGLRRHISNTRNGTDISADLASISSSSSSSDAGSLNQATIEALISKRLPSRSSPRPSLSPQVSPMASESSMTERHGSPITSPMRRLSVEDVEFLTRATRDGHEASLPSLAPPIPPLSEHLPIKPNEFPPARSPVLLTGTLSGDGHCLSPSLQAQTDSGRRQPAVNNRKIRAAVKAGSPLENDNKGMLSMNDNRGRQSSDDNRGRQSSDDNRMEEGISPPAVLKDHSPIDGGQQNPTKDVVNPRSGSHFLQKKLKEVAGGGAIDPSLLGGGHVEWNTLWISNIESGVSERMLEHEIRSAGCRHLKDVRLVKDRFKHSKGFAYVEFDDADSAREAEKVMGGRLINGLRLKAAISVPKGPLYEEKTVFVSHIPQATQIPELKSLFGRISAGLFDQYENERGRKRGLQEADVSSRKRCRLTDQRSEEGSGAATVGVTAGEDDDRMGDTTETKDHVEAGPWHVTDVRLRENVDSEGNIYGYVDMSHKIAVEGLLRAQEADKSLFILNGHQLVIAPSVPKRVNNSTIKAPKNAQMRGSTTKSGYESVDPKLLSKTLFVSNMPPFYTEKKLKSIMGVYGQVVRAHVPPNVEKEGRNRGFGLVEFDNAMDAAMALSSLNGKLVDKRTLNVQQSTRPVPEMVAAREEINEAKEIISKGRITLGSVEKRHVGKKVSPSSGTEDKPTSNEEFRKKFLLG